VTVLAIARGETGEDELALPSVGGESAPGADGPGRHRGWGVWVLSLRCSLSCPLCCCCCLSLSLSLCLSALCLCSALLLPAAQRRPQGNRRSPGKRNASAGRRRDTHNETPRHTRTGETSTQEDGQTDAGRVSAEESILAKSEIMGQNASQRVLSSFLPACVSSLCVLLVLCFGALNLLCFALLCFAFVSLCFGVGLAG
jgi:hypothetical protein